MQRCASLARLVLLAGLVVSVGCAARPKPARFNNDMARANQRLAAEGKAFYKTLAAFREKGEAPDPRRVRSAYQSLESALAEVKKEYERARTPVKNEGLAADLLAKYKDFLEVQQKLIDGPILRIVR